MSNEIFQSTGRIDVNLEGIHRRITHLYPESFDDALKNRFPLERRREEEVPDWRLKEREQITKLNNDACGNGIQKSDWIPLAHRNDSPQHQPPSENAAVKQEESGTESASANISDNQASVISSTDVKSEGPPQYPHQNNYPPIKQEPFQEFIQKYERPEFGYHTAVAAGPSSGSQQYLNSNHGYYYDNYGHQNLYPPSYNPAPYTPPSGADAKPQVSPTTPSTTSDTTESSEVQMQRWISRRQRHRDSQAARRLNPDYRRAEQEADRQRKRVRRTNPEYRRIENARNSMRNRIRRSDPIYRATEQKVDAIRKRLKRNDPEYRKKEQERNNLRNRLRRLDPEYREAERVRSANRKRIKRSDPEYRKREQELDRERKKRKKNMKRDQQSLVSNQSSEASSGQPLQNEFQHNFPSSTESPSASHSHQQPSASMSSHDPVQFTQNEELKMKIMKLGERHFPQIPTPISHIYSLQRNFMENCGFHTPPLSLAHTHHHPHHHVPVNRHSFRSFEESHCDEPPPRLAPTSAPTAVEQQQQQLHTLATAAAVQNN